MKTILYMAMSANGYIAKENDDTGWISKDEWDAYSAFVRKRGNLIVGRRTYEILTKQPEFSEFEKVKIVVVSRNDFVTLAPHHLVAKTPADAASLLNNFEEIVIAGGGQINSAFLKMDLIDEIYLDVEPTILGKGIKLFTDDDFETTLELLEVNKLNKNTVQLHYKKYIN